MERLQNQIKHLKHRLSKKEAEKSDESGDDEDYEEPNQYMLDILQTIQTKGGAIKLVSPKTIR